MMQYCQSVVLLKKLVWYAFSQSKSLRLMSLNMLCWRLPGLACGLCTYGWCLSSNAYPAARGSVMAVSLGGAEAVTMGGLMHCGA